MNKHRRMTNAAWLLAAGLALCGASSAVAGPGPMQVEEPDLKGAKPPIQPEKDQAGWKHKKSAGLTPTQKAALKARQETMKDMVALIQQKRRALKEARPEDREALAQELHNLIIEKAQVAAERRDRKDGNREPGFEKPGDSDLDKNARVRNAAPGSEQKLRKLEHMEEVQRQQELRRRALEEKLKQLENNRGGNSNGNGNGNGNGNDD